MILLPDVFSQPTVLLVVAALAASEVAPPTSARLTTSATTKLEAPAKRLKPLKIRADLTADSLVAQPR